MIKKCIICGSDFEPARHLQKNQVCCCKECSAVFQKQQRKAYNQAHREEIREQQRIYKEKKYPRYCQICGERIPRGSAEGKARTHDECILRKCGEFYKNGEKLPSYWEYKLSNRGFTRTEAKEAVGMELKCLYCGKPLDIPQQKYCCYRCYYSHHRAERENDCAV